MPHGQAFVHPSGIWHEGPFRWGFKSLSKRANLVLFSATASAVAIVGLTGTLKFCNHITQVSYGHFKGKSLVYRESMVMTHEVPPLVEENETMKE